MFKVALLYALPALWVKTPFVMTALIGQILLLLTIFIAGESKLLASILFLVYVGGLMVLFSYCVMMTPVNKGQTLFLFPVAFMISYTGYDCYSLGLLVSMSVMLLMVLLLFVVLIAIVEIVGYSCGTLKC